MLLIIQHKKSDYFHLRCYPSWVCMIIPTCWIKPVVDLWILYHF